MSLYNALQTRSVGQNTLPDELNALVDPLVTRFNSEVTTRLLSRLPDETLPTTPRDASSFRSRVSLLVEYSLIEMMADFLNDDAAGLNVTFNTTNQFADCFIRNDNWDIELRIDIKTLHDLSEEASARFSEPTQTIRELDDYLFYLAWQWRTTHYLDVEVILPFVLDAVFIPAIEVAEERDRRQKLAGGSFDSEGRALAKSGAPDSNFGKINRLVHVTRRNSSDLSPRIQKLLSLMDVQAEARTAVPSPMADAEKLADIADADAVTDATDDA